MPSKRAIKRAKEDAKAGKAPTTQAGEFVREEMEKMKRGQGRAKSPRQAIAIGLSEARREGVKLPPPPGGKRAGRGAKKTSSAGRKAAGKKAAAKNRGTSTRK